MHIFLIRHGESTVNTGENFIKRLPDHLVSLTDNGKNQAFTAGQKLKRYCTETGVDLLKARIWRSPYLRTRQTSEEFNKSLSIYDIKEDITLAEQQYGLFDSLPWDMWGEMYPTEFNEYLRQIDNSGKFYARFPMGESPFDVAVRIHQFIDTIYRDYEREGISTLFVFTHGTALRAFLLRWFHYSPEWYENENNPNNCWIREIKNGKDHGYLKFL